MTRYAIRIGLGIAALALFVTALPNTAQAGGDVGDGHPTGAIRGIVVDEHGEPVPGARVRLFRPGHRRHAVARTVTNEDGLFGFRHVPVGRYVAAAGKREVGRGRARVAVHENEVSRVRIVIGM